MKTINENQRTRIVVLNVLKSSLWSRLIFVSMCYRLTTAWNFKVKQRTLVVRYEGKSISKLKNRDWKETNGDNDIQTFIFQRNFHTNLNTYPNFSQVPGKLRRKILVVTVGPTRTLPIDSMFVFDTCSPFRELLHPIMDCLTWQAMFTVHGQHFFVDILCCHTFCPQKPHKTTLFYCGTRIQGSRHLVTAVPSLQSCAYRSLYITN